MNQTTEAPEIVEAEIVETSSAMAVTAFERAQIDVQISTAKQYPRTVAKCRREAMELVTLDQDTAESMHYALPRKDKNGKQIFIEGPSVRFAEVIAYSWQNIRVEKRIVGADETHVTAQATCMDLERNTGIRAEVKRRITDKNGRRFNDDMITVTGNAAASIALRNAVFAVVPRALWKTVEDAAKKMATGGTQPIELRRQKALFWFARVGAHEQRVLDLLGVASVNDITEEHLQTLTGLRNAIGEGDTTVEEAFGTPDTGAQASPLNEKVKAAKKNGPGELPL